VATAQVYEPIHREVVTVLAIVVVWDQQPMGGMRKNNSANYEKLVKNFDFDASQYAMF